MHGLGAKQTRAKQQQRLALWEVQQERAAHPAVVIRQEPEELLLTALDDVNQVLSAIKAQMQNNIVDPLLLETCGQWLDRLGRLGKVIVDGDLSTRLHQRLGWLAEDRSAVVWAHLSATLQASTLTAAQKLAVWQARFDGLRLIANADAPFRLSGGALHRFSDGLLEAAARERAVADGVVWGDDDSESDSDVGEFVLFSSNGDGLVS